MQSPPGLRIGYDVAGIQKSGALNKRWLYGLIVLK
jgi:hypothetical protein